MPSSPAKALCELSHKSCWQSRRFLPRLFACIVHLCLFTDQKLRYVCLSLFLCGCIPPLFLPLFSHCMKTNILFRCFYIFELRFKCQKPVEGQILDQHIAECSPGKMGRAQTEFCGMSGYHLFIFSYHCLLLSCSLPVSSQSLTQEEQLSMGWQTIQWFP